MIVDVRDHALRAVSAHAATFLGIAARSPRAPELVALNADGDPSNVLDFAGGEFDGVSVTTS